MELSLERLLIYQPGPAEAEVLGIHAANMKDTTQEGRFCRVQVSHNSEGFNLAITYLFLRQERLSEI